MKNKDLREDIEKIVTYHSEDDIGSDGTSGYLLSNEQIDRIIEMFDSRLGELRSQIKDMEKPRRILGSFSEEIEFQAQDVDNGFNDALKKVLTLIDTLIPKEEK